MADPRTPGRARALLNLALASGNRAPMPAPAVSKIGMPAGPVNRNQAQVQEPGSGTGAASTRASATTYFTKAPQVGEPTPILYSADRLWARVTLILETAGPVAVGFDSGLLPVTSGKGILLTTNLPIVLDVPKGSKLYIQATGVNRVKVIVQSIPWLEQITGLLLKIAKTFGVTV